MNFWVVSLKPGTSSSLGHAELRCSQKDSFWSATPVLGRICDCISVSHDFEIFLEPFAHLVLPPVVRLDVVGDSGLDFLRQVEKLPREGELAFYLLDCDAMVDKCEESGAFGGLNDFLYDNLLPGLEVYMLLADFIETRVNDSYPSRKWRGRGASRPC